MSNVIRAVVLPLLLFVCLASNVAARDDYARLAAFDARHYSVSLEIRDEGDEISAETEITFAVNAEAGGELPLDFGALTVDALTVDGKPAVYSHGGEKLRVTLPRVYRRGESFLVSVRYHGHPTDGLYFKRNKFGDRTVFADNWPNRAHHWFPSVDHPYDKATVGFRVTAPARFEVVANGALVERTSRQDGTELTHWRESVPVPVYCMVVCAAEFSVLNAAPSNATPLFYYLFPRDREHGLTGMKRALAILDFYTRVVGPFPYEKMAFVQSSTRFGGMENASNVFLDEKAIKQDATMDGLLAHETAHQWFGDSVTAADWHHVWLSEGFATYFGALFFESADGRASFREKMLANKESYLKEPASHARPVIDPAIKDLFKLLNRNSYAKGAWVLHMLRREVGDDKFFAGVREYYTEHRDSTALTEDLRRAMERQAGRTLEPFFRQWLYEPGHPVIEAAWRWDEATKRLRLTLRQTQTPTTFRFPLDVEITTGGRARRETVQVTSREQSFDLRADARPDALALDPDEWLLKVLTLNGQSKP